MVCKHLKIERPIQIIGLENQAETFINASCLIKKIGQVSMVEIYDWHKSVGIEKGDISSNCPFYPNGDYLTCKWYEKNE